MQAEEPKEAKTTGAISRRKVEQFSYPLAQRFTRRTGTTAGLDRSLPSEEHSRSSNKTGVIPAEDTHACEVWGHRLRCDWSAAAYSGMCRQSGLKTGRPGRSGRRPRGRAGQEILRQALHRL